MRRYFVTGGTGFIGREIVRQLLKREDTEWVTCLTRGERNDYLSHPRLGFWQGDVTECKLPYDFTDCIHGANEVNDLLQPDQHRYYYTIVEGTNRVLRLAQAWNMRTLVLSSGAVARDTIYGRAKRQCEAIARSYGGNTKIARIFSVIGPEMPLNGQYAAGTFVHMARQGQVNVWGGTSVRTYLDVEDCARWLLQILDTGEPLKPYDVAGNMPIPILGLALEVARVFGVPCKHDSSGNREDNYLPDIESSLALGCEQKISLTQSLERIRDRYKAVSVVRDSNVDAPERA